MSTHVSRMATWNKESLHKCKVHFVEGCCERTLVSLGNPEMYKTPFCRGKLLFHISAFFSSSHASFWRASSSRPADNHSDCRIAAIPCSTSTWQKTKLYTQPTVDGRNPAPLDNFFDPLNYLYLFFIIFCFSTIPGGDLGFLPSTVVPPTSHAFASVHSSTTYFACFWWCETYKQISRTSSSQPLRDFASPPCLNPFKIDSKRSKIIFLLPSGVLAFLTYLNRFPML